MSNSKVRFALSEQLSEDALSKSEAVTVTKPFTSKLTEVAAKSTTGPELSTTVTIAVSEEELFDSSVPVKVTVTGAPTSAQSNSVWFNDNVSVQLSDEGVASLSTMSGVMTAFPEESNSTVISWATTVGSWVSNTVIDTTFVVTLL